MTLVWNETSVIGSVSFLGHERTAREKADGLQGCASRQSLPNLCVVRRNLK